MDMRDALAKLYPAVRGEYCWLASEVLKRIDQYKPLNMKRHADFDKLFQAGLAAVGIADPEEEYRKILKARIAVDSKVLLKTSETLSLVVDVVKELGMLPCTMDELHGHLTKHNNAGVYIPANGAALGKYINTNMSILKGMGIAVFILSIKKIFLVWWVNELLAHQKDFRTSRYRAPVSS